MTTRASVRKHRAIWRLRKAHGWGSKRIGLALKINPSTVQNHLRASPKCKCDGARWRSIRLTPIDWSRGDHDRRCAVCRHSFSVLTVRYKATGKTQSKWPICQACRSDGWYYGRVAGNWYLSRDPSKAWQRTDGNRSVGSWSDEQREGARTRMLRRRVPL